MNLKIKKGKRKRILFFGDSNTAGDGVNNNERYAELFKEKSLIAEVIIMLFQALPVQINSS